MTNNMKYNPEIHHRRSIRLKNYDYSQAGSYFVTICTQNRECLFGNINNGQMDLNEAGKIVDFTWNDLPNHNENIILDAFVIMPNHIHGIITIVGAGSKPALFVNAGSKPALFKNRAGYEPAPTNDMITNRTNLSEIIRQFKTFSARLINKMRNTPGIPVWQRNYYEHIIRNETELHKLREYIINNPLNWQTDENYRK